MNNRSTTTKNGIIGMNRPTFVTLSPQSIMGMRCMLCGYANPMDFAKTLFASIYEEAYRRSLETVWQQQEKRRKSPHLVADSDRANNFAIGRSL